MEFRRVINTGSTDFDEAMEIYLSCFPPGERHPIELVRTRVNNGSSELYVGSSGNELAFMALLWPLSNTDFILLDYMATKNTHQGKGIASAFLNRMRDVLKSRDKYFILEVEDPRHGDNKQERERRVSFYKRNGVKELKGAKYILPPLAGTAPTEMILMVYPEYKNKTIGAEAVKKTIAQIYRELYDRDERDPLLNSFVHDIRGPVKLI